MKVNNLIHAIVQIEALDGSIIPIGTSGRIDEIDGEFYWVRFTLFPRSVWICDDSQIAPTTPGGDDDAR